MVDRTSVIRSCDGWMGETKQGHGQAGGSQHRYQQLSLGGELKGFGVQYQKMRVLPWHPLLKTVETGGGLRKHSWNLVTRAPAFLLPSESYKADPDCCPRPREVSTRLLTHDPRLFLFLMLRQLYFYFLKMSFYLARVAGAYYSHCHIRYNAFLWGQILTSVSPSEESVPRMPQRPEEICL